MITRTMHKVKNNHSHYGPKPKTLHMIFTLRKIDQLYIWGMNPLTFLVYFLHLTTHYCIITMLRLTSTLLYEGAGRFVHILITTIQISSIKKFTIKYNFKTFFQMFFRNII